MKPSLYFYDLETSGISGRRDRIMQFAGQRTDMNLKPIGKPDNLLVKITPDVLPQPEAILVHGITPQKTIAEGLSEADFVKYLVSQVFLPDTVFVGFNNIRFDDEFIRFLLWRNFTDAYEWQWKDGRSRWDLLDMVRMTRALRPDGIEWAFAPDGKPSNRLELLSSVNKLAHVNAHDALSDVNVAIALAQLIRSKQPKLFNYLLSVRDKHKVAALVGSGQPFVYTSGRYPSQYAHTTVALKLADHPDRDAAVAYDLRTDPADFTNLSEQQLAKKWSEYGKDAPYFPVKVLAYNRCPAVAPLPVLDKASAKRLNLDSRKLDAHRKALPKDFGAKLVKALELNLKKSQIEAIVDQGKVDEMLYDGFVNGADKVKMRAVRGAGDKLDELDIEFNDKRLQALLPLYKARNYPKMLDADEQTAWENFRRQKLFSAGHESSVADYFHKLDELGTRPGLAADSKYVLEELALYAESIVPSE